MRRARRWWIAGIALAVLVVVTLGAVVLYRWQLPRVREQLVSILSEQLGARVELAELEVVLGREVQVVGRGLVLHHKTEGQGRPPLVRIERFTIARARAGHPAQADPRQLGGARTGSRSSCRSGGQARLPTPDTAAVRSRGVELHRALHGPSPVVIDTLRSTDATLAIESSKPDRPPRTFEIHDLVLTDAAFDRPVSFNARLTNPKPTGLITASRTVRSLGGRPAVGEPGQRLVPSSRTPTWTPSRASTARWSRWASSPARSIGSTSRAPRRRRTSAWTSAGRPSRCRRRLSRWWTAPTATPSCTTSTRGSPTRRSRRKAASSTRPAGRAAPSYCKPPSTRGSCPTCCAWRSTTRSRS